MFAKSSYLRSASFAAISTLPVILGCALLGASATRAAPYVVTIDQEGPNVVATNNTDGEFNLSSGLTAVTGITVSPQIWPSMALLRLSSSGGQFSSGFEFTEPGAPTAVGVGSTTNANSSSGPPVAFQGFGFNTLAGGSFFLDLPAGYASGSPLGFSENTWNNMTFATLGITPGLYTWSSGPAADQSFTIDAVPVPAALPLFGTGL